MIANAADGVPDLSEDGREQQEQKILNTEDIATLSSAIFVSSSTNGDDGTLLIATIAIFLFSVHYLPAGICVSLLLLSFSVCSCENYRVHYLSPKRYYAFFLFVTGQ